MIIFNSFGLIKCFKNVLFNVVFIVFLLLILCIYKYKSSNVIHSNFKINLDLDNLPNYFVNSEDLIEITNKNCTFWNCFDVYRCGRKTESGRISVYVYPFYNYVDKNGKKINFPMSKEFYLIIKTIVNSPYYTSNPNTACIFIPSIDTLNLLNVDYIAVSKTLTSLP